MKEKQVKKKETVKGTSVGKVKKSAEKRSVVDDIKKDAKTVEKTKTVPEITVEDTPIIKEVVTEKKSGFNTIEVVLIMIITLFFGGVIGGIIGYTAHGKEGTIISNNESVPSELSEFISVYNELKNSYYTDLDENKLLEAGIKGLVDYLGDPFSSYMTKTETTSFNEIISGKYSGIGAEILNSSEKGFVIVNLFENSPASNAGIKEGDIIIKVDGQDITSLTTTELGRQLKGTEGTSVVVTVLREQEEISFNLVRRNVEIISVTSEVIEENDKKVGLIRIGIFAENTAAQFEQELVSLRSEGIDSLVVDVRSNSGGHLNVAEKIASLFLKKGSIIYQLETKGLKQPIYTTSSSNFDLPVVVLVNHSSASAAEILAASLKESYGAVLVGETTYGKGTVQRTQSLSSGAQIKYTIQKWLTPNGNWVHGTGITPDITLTLDDTYYESPSNENDNQLQKAIEVLLEQ